MKIEQDVRDALEDTLSKIVEIFENRVDKTNSVENTSNDDTNQISCKFVFDSLFILKELLSEFLNIHLFQRL